MKNRILNYLLDNGSIVWKDITNYEGLYQINNLGQVKRVAHKRFDRNQQLPERAVKSICPSNGSYKYLSLCKNGVYKTYTIHRLLAKAFLQNPNNYPCINHIDGNRQNNNLNNLEWCSYQHNNKEACRIGLNKGTSKTVYQFNMNGDFIRKWDSGKKAEQSLNITHVADCCNGKRKTSGNYKWSYVELEK